MTTLLIPQIAGIASANGVPGHMVKEAVTWAMHLSNGDDHLQDFAPTSQGWDVRGLWALPTSMVPRGEEWRLFDPRFSARLVGQKMKRYQGDWSWHPFNTPPPPAALWAYVYDVMAGLQKQPVVKPAHILQETVSKLDATIRRD